MNYLERLLTTKLVRCKNLEQLNEFRRVNGLTKCVSLFSLTYKAFLVLFDRRLVWIFDPNLCLLEYVYNNTSRPYFDFDGQISEQERDNISNWLKHYFWQKHQVEVYVNWAVSGYPPNDKYHCVISGVSLSNCWREYNLLIAKQMLEVFSQYSKLVDLQIYRSNSSLRLILQNKMNKNNIIDTNKTKTFCSQNIFLDYYLITPNDEDIKIEYHISLTPKTNPSNIHWTGDELAVRRVLERCNLRLPEGYILGKRFGDMCCYLKRLYPIPCLFCGRVHGKDNTLYLIFLKTRIYLRCFRLPNDMKYTIVYHLAEPLDLYVTRSSLPVRSKTQSNNFRAPFGK